VATEIQIAKLNDTVRPALETLVRVIHELRAVTDDLTAFQASGDAFPIDANPIVDNRLDVPAINGNQVQSVIDNCDAMLAEVTAGEESVLIQLMARPLSIVVRLG